MIDEAAAWAGREPAAIRRLLNIGGDVAASPAIHQILDQVDQALVRYVAAPGEMGEPQSAADPLTDSPLSHLSYEERELLAPLARYGF